MHSVLFNFCLLRAKAGGLHLWERLWFWYRFSKVLKHRLAYFLCGSWMYREEILGKDPIVLPSSYQMHNRKSSWKITSNKDFLQGKHINIFCSFLFLMWLYSDSVIHIFWEGISFLCFIIVCQKYSYLLRMIWVMKKLCLNLWDLEILNRAL